MKKHIIIIFSLLTALFSWSFYSRSRMNYNLEGKYFDKETLIVYDQQAVMVYGLITFILLSLTLLTTLKLKSIKNKNCTIFYKKPLFCWYIDAIIGSKTADEIWIATDCLKVVKIAKEKYPNVHIFHRAKENPCKKHSFLN